MKLNRLLRDSDRIELTPVILEMGLACPEMMARKYPEANVQQAWVLQRVRDLDAKEILCVGCFEDTAYEVLRQSKDNFVFGIDPAVNFNLAWFRGKFSEIHFPCAFACSVIEHIQDDEEFIRDICDTLTTGGTAILTCDFKSDYKPGDSLPESNVRFYTEADINRLGGVIASKGCAWVDVPDMTGEPDFTLPGTGRRYSFASMVFTKT